MPIRRIDPVTVLDEETGQTYYFPDTGEEPGVPSVTRPTPTGLPRYVPPAPPPEVSIGEAQIERPPQVDIGEAVVEDVGDPNREVPRVTEFWDPRTPLGPGAREDWNLSAADRDIRDRILAAAPTGPDDPRLAPPAPAKEVPTPAAPVTPAQSQPRARAQAPGGLLDSRRRAAQSQLDVDLGAASADQEYAGAAKTADEEFAAAQDAAMRKAETDAERRWTDWKKRYDEAAASEVNPERFWSSRSSYQKGIWLLSLAAHAWTQDKFGGKNVALGLLQQEIERDIAAQESNRAARMKGIEGEARFLEGQDRRGQDALENRATAHGLRLNALKRGLEARVAALGPAAAGAKYDQALATIEEDEIRLSEELRQKQHARAVQNAQLGLQRQRLDLERQQEARLKKAAEAKPGGEEDGPNLDPRLGLTTIRADGTKVPGGWALTKSHEQATKVAQAAASGNKEYTASVALREALKDQSLLDKLRSSSAEVRAEAVKLAYGRARQLGGPGVLTDQDVDTAMQTITGQKGLDAWSYLVTAGDPVTLVEDGIRTLRQRVNNEILGTGAVDVSRGSIVWEPQLLRPSEPGKRTAADVRTEAAGTIGGETGVAPRRQVPLTALPTLAQDAVYARERATGTAPILAPSPEGEAVESILASVREPSTPLADIDAAIRQVETSRAKGELRGRALAELRVLRAAAARRDRDLEARRGTRQEGVTGTPARYSRD